MSGTPVTGTATVVLGDVAGSTRLWSDHPRGMATASVRLRELVVALADAHRGHLPREQGEGDNVVAVFASATDAVAFASGLDRALESEPWPDGLTVRMRFGLHTGDVEWDEHTGYLGPTFNRCARLRDLGHARMVLLSQATGHIVADTLPDGATIVDLGFHQLRDLSRAEHVFQLRHPDSPAEFAPLKSVTSLPNNLPVPVTSLVGRDDDITHVARLLSDHRLVTLTGAGGSGKTRLAQHVASAVLQFAPDGAWWVDLLPVADDERVPVVIAEAAGIDDVLAGAAGAQMLAAGLGSRELLLVIDNCEHVIDAVADTVELLLTRCPELRVLATSRESLDVPGEHALRVRPLDTPDADDPTTDDLLAHPATALFVERATSLSAEELDPAGRRSVVNVCRRLDGLPLAIELAAARTRMLSVRQIEEGLDDRFGLLTPGRRQRRSGARQRTLEASIGWSYDLLDEDEQAMLCRLAVFPGPFDLVGARAVGALGDGAPAMDLLSALVDKSLVTVRPADDERRYRLLESIRHYGLERLRELGEADTARDAHLDLTLGRLQTLVDANTTWDGAIGPVVDIPPALADDIRVADEWAHRTGRVADAVDLHWPLLFTLLLRGSHHDVRASVEAAVDGDHDLDLEHRARAHAMLQNFLAAANRHEEAIARSDVAIEVGRELFAVSGREAVLAATLGGTAWAMAWSSHGGSVPARECIDLARRSAQSANEPGRLAQVATFATMALAYDGFEAEAYQVSREAVDAATAAGLVHVRAINAGYLLAFAERTGRPAAVIRQLLHEAREAIPETDLRFECLLTCIPGVWAAAFLGDPDSAAREVERGFAQAGPPGSATHTLMVGASATAAWFAGDVDETIARAEQALVVFDRTSNRWWQGHMAWLRADAKVRRGDPDAADALAVARSRLPGDGYFVIRANLHASAARLLAATDPVGALAEACLGLSYMRDHGTSTAWVTLPEVARALLAADSHAEAARALGALRRFLEDRDYHLTDADEHEAMATACRDELGPAAFDEAFTAGYAMTDGQVYAWLLDDDTVSSGDRPVAGWGALTRAEVDVARKIAEGMTTAEAADALFVSANTVKTHLKSVYSKLSISSRAELATEVARRDGASHPG